MGREVKRVPLDFDWPLEKVWPGYMGGICTESIGYAIGNKDADLETMCGVCRHFGRLAGIMKNGDPDGCPETKINPPNGEGWQLWETVSEGSPISPVFETGEQLAQFLVDGGGHPLGDPPTFEQAWNFVRAGWAPSMVMEAGSPPESGVVAVGRFSSKEGGHG